MSFMEHPDSFGDPHHQRAFRRGRKIIGSRPFGDGTVYEDNVGGLYHSDHHDTPYPTCVLCGAYSIFKMTSDGPVWERGCRCFDYPMTTVVPANVPHGRSPLDDLRRQEYHERAVTAGLSNSQEQEGGGI